MDSIAVSLMCSSIILATVRNVLSKKISGLAFGTKVFFFVQAVTFFSGGILIALIGDISIVGIAPLTLVYAILYGVVLLLAQWCYTTAMKSGKIGICNSYFVGNCFMERIYHGLWHNGYCAYCRGHYSVR